MSSTHDIPIQLPQDEQYPMSIERGDYSPLSENDWPVELTEGFSLNQTTSQCCRCCCFQPNIDWKVYPFQNNETNFETIVSGPHVWTIREDATFWGRTCSYCYPGARQTTYLCGVEEYDTSVDLNQSPPPINTSIIRHEKNCSCPINAIVGCDDHGPVRVPCCCNLPYLNTYDTRTNTKLGSTKLLCNCKPLCCPKFAVYDHTNRPKYLIRPDLCCCNCCYVCPKCQSGTKCCYVPFYIRDFETEEKLDPTDGDVAIIDLYIGMKHECCTKKNLYSVKFPSTATAADKATLMGATLLYDVLINEQNYD